jgi:hypothetical protein
MRFESIMGFLGIMAAVIIGACVPIWIYRAGDLASAVISVIAIAGASLLAIVVVAISLGIHEEIAGKMPEEEIARAYIARQKVILEQMDETVKLLKEIRDSLKREVEG